MPDVPGGYFGRALVVDVTDGSAEELPLDEKTLRRYVGGVGLGTYLMHRLAPRGVEPLAPEAPLAFVFSPLVGTPLTTSAKFAVVAKSPLTDRLNDALSSSHFAISGKLTGYDALVVTGAHEAPSVLLVDGDGPRVHDAADLWGLPAAEADPADVAAQRLLVEWELLRGAVRDVHDERPPEVAAWDIGHVPSVEPGWRPPGGLRATRRRRRRGRRRCRRSPAARRGRA